MIFSYPIVYEVRREIDTIKRRWLHTLKILKKSYSDCKWPSSKSISSTQVLMSSLEEKFDISIETDDVIDFSSFKKGQEILSSKYAVNF